MKKINTVIFFSLIVLCGFVWRGFQPDLINTSPKEHNVETVLDTVESIKPVKNVEKSVFIPYWNIRETHSEIEEYDKAIYFGVAPDKNGDLIDDTGFQYIDKFIDVTNASQDKLLTVRMLDIDVNLAVLEDDLVQKNLANNVGKIISDNDFDGVVLDLELSVLPTASVSNQITSFVKSFSEGLKIGTVPNRDSPVFLALYGDTFYRGRPYDVEKLAKYVDGIYIMAYDFHKSRGEPGPNYPLNDFKQMIKDFSAIVPRENITVIFGMYGYDWTLGSQGLPLKAAVAVPINEIDTSGANIDPKSKEKNITYTDDEGYDHVLWYEDLESSDVKIEYLKSQGIGSVGYWVWGYY
ncbi:hypothetical protein COT97_02465 [Candidatus Falkowbacteria bacterium CG10_big_fil_rev_8_21_14_0_10_39_11]|uniref:GH18 domain-containing protein n=1 Tax=Candidatus Falkowbacteria bacterium CG10_big_fil_rev_8_21_14_0_10_39_11 TaxID=1974565 RepID=A0A2H0V587_9BACT|nr:MAG: hypothetical protein COT97_02465 [Candidatus Falkowbacteria bacterium CG10_big_fil_rev_8_21_14_0_10_39_11]